jgi:hypothetical protein
MTDLVIELFPTILHLLDQIAAEVEYLRNDPRYFLLSNMGGEGKFELVPDGPEGLCVLKPTTSTFNSYFRGQIELHDNCCPTIYRGNGKDETDRFIERLRTSEFELLLKKHPFVKLVYDNGIVVNNFGEDLLVKLKVDAIGLAQHYGLETDMMDFTSDKWVAAFFATCVYHKGNYLPIDNSKLDKKYGVVYRYNSMMDEFLPLRDVPPPIKKFSAIGLQPFKRPGEQKGFALRMDKGENLNNMNGITSYFFRHDNLASEIIYNRMNRGKELFPYDELEGDVHKIKVSKKISNEAFQLTFDKFPLDYLDIEILRGQCIKKGIRFVNYPIVNFPKGLETLFLKDWEKRGEKEFFSKIVYQPVYYPPEIVD